MARFNPRRMAFGVAPRADDDGGRADPEGLPAPARVALAARRAAGVAEALDLVLGKE